MLDIASIRDVILNNLIESNKMMSRRMNKMDDKIINLERQINVNTQRAIENNLEFHGVPDDVNDDSLQEPVIGMLQ